MKVDNLKIKHFFAHGRDNYICVNDAKKMVQTFHDTYDFLVFLEDYYGNENYANQLKSNKEIKAKLNARLDAIKNAKQ